jgi:hypothetical protein
MNQARAGFRLEAQRHWLVCFWNPPTRRHWMEWLFSGTGPRHVVLFAYLALPGVWIQIDWALDGHSLCLLEDDEAWRLFALLHARGATILRWQVPDKKPRQRLLAPNCTGFAQRFLGIAGLFWTPRGLLKCMLASGAPSFFAVSQDEASPHQSSGEDHGPVQRAEPANDHPGTAAVSGGRYPGPA